METKRILQKYKRRRTKTRDLFPIGDFSNCRMYYPHNVNSCKEQYGNGVLHGFRIRTYFLSKKKERKIPIELEILLSYNYHSLKEFILVHTKGAPVFYHQRFWEPFEDGIKLKIPDYAVNEPRKLITPNRKTLDGYGLNISMFQRDNYLGIPVCLATQTKENVNEGWLYVYSTTVGDIDGIGFETDSQTPIKITGELRPV